MSSIAVKADELEIYPVSTERSAIERPHVLIVGDDKDLTGFLSEGLMLGGFWISAIASGLQALEVFRLRTFDLVLIDATLSGMGALELIRRLRSTTSDDAPRTDVPLLVIAGSEDEIQKSDVAEAGADGLLLPPLELDELIPAMFQLVNAWREAHPDRPWADAALKSTANT
jgi:DNA-binding response OmpR family regulator